MARIIVPTNNQVLVRRRSRSRKTDGGLHIPDSAAEVETFEGEVLAVGPGRFVDYYGNPDYKLDPTEFPHSAAKDDHRTALERKLVVANFAPMPCKVGDVVITTKNGTELEDDLWLFCDHDILAIVTGGN